MSITIKDIARAAGVSHPTVSRALNGNPAISEKTRERIVKLAAEMGYVPNASARGLKTSRTRALGVIVSRIDDPFWSEVLNGVDSVLHPAGYSIFIAATHRDREREKQVVQTMLQRGVDGVILLAPQFAADQSHLLKQFGLPMVMVNNEGAAECNRLIYNDDEFGIGLIAQHLVAFGHTRIAFLGNKKGGLTDTNRRAGLIRALGSASIPIRDEYFYSAASGDPSGGQEGCLYFLGLTDRPTALICYNDYMAVGVYHTLAENHVTIPVDMSVAGFDNINIAAFLTPSLTTLHQHKFAMGTGAANMMLELMNKKGKSSVTQDPKKVSMQGVLKIRASTAPPRELQ